jgi:hypothetical protein
LIMGSRQIAKALGYKSQSTVCGLINSDKLPVIVRGRRFITTQGAIDQWLKSQLKPLSKHKTTPHRQSSAPSPVDKP